MFHPNCCVFQSTFAQYIVSLCCRECHWFRIEIQLNLKIFFVPFGFFLLSWENTNSCICRCAAEVTPSLCMNCKNRNKSCCQTSLVAQDNQSITDSSRVAALLPTGARKEEQNVNFLRCHYVRDGYTSDKSAVYHGADARRQTRTVTLTRTDNSESINLTWLSWECWSQPTRHRETSRKSWKCTPERLNIYVAINF